MTRTLIASTFLAVLLAGCGTEEGLSMFACEPQCPTGQRCTEQGCVLEVAATPDLAMAAPVDQASGCNPPCSAGTPICNAMGRCVRCAVDSDCPVGQQCKPVGATTACVAGCNDDARCGGGTSRCCNGHCTDTNSDAAHCGACGQACGAIHSSARCEAGACVPGSCHRGYGDCNANPTDGCEAKLDADAAHCNGCGKACKVGNGIAGCGGATLDNPSGCYLKACLFGFADCNLDESDGCEKSTLSDLANCGGCGMPCKVPPNGRASCRNASCSVAGCNNNFADCDGLYVNGCEIAILNDVKNCGGCGKACVQGNICVGGACTCPQCNNLFPNAAAKCINNQCVFDTCNPGFSDCDANLQNGCERSVSSDPAHCGACGNACANPTPYCFAGKCSSVLENCYAIKQSNPNSADGIYTIDPDANGPKQPFSVYCEMTSDGGGWEVMAYIRKPQHWDWALYSDNGNLGDDAGGFSAAATLKTVNDSFNEKIIIYKNLMENNGSLGQQWMIVRRADNAPIPFGSIDTRNGWSYRDSYGKTSLNAGDICSHGCAQYRGHGMFHDNTDINWHGTQGGDYGCRDGNNICWMSRGQGCNVGSGRCAYITGNGEGVIYGVRNKQ